MTALQYISHCHLEFDHIELHALGGSDHFSNLTPMPFKAHREKSRIDTSKVAKVKRNEDKWSAFMRATAKGKKPPPKRSRWPSRPFAKKRRPLRRSRQLPNA
jgi:hypothetical protein